MLSMIINWMNQLNDQFVRFCFLLGNTYGLLGCFIPCVLKGHLSLVIQYWNGDLLNINSGLQHIPFVEQHISLTVCISVLLKMIFSIKAGLQC